MSGIKSTLGKVTLKVSPDKLRAILDKKETSSSPESKNIKSETSVVATPGSTGTTMAPPAKKGVKRSAPGANGEPRDRKKPGPKKKRLDDGEPRAERGHKLGPKANQGAINAGLRALDRTGKPCRRWVKSSFTLKSFTGVTWEIKRWSTPVQLNADGTIPGLVATTEKTKDDIKPEKVDGRRRKAADKTAADAKKLATPADPKVEAKSTPDSNGDGQDVEMQDAPPVSNMTSSLPLAITAN